MNIKISENLFCPVCGKKIKLEKMNLEYCGHVEYVYGWFSGDDDCWIYVKPQFGKQYYASIASSGELKEYFNKNECKISQKQANQFILGNFDPMDEISKLIPYFHAHDSNSNVIFNVEWGNYSGAYVGIRCS